MPPRCGARSDGARVIRAGAALDERAQLERHLALFIDAYDTARRLKTLKGLRPAQFIWREWQAIPDLFHRV